MNTLSDESFDEAAAWLGVETSCAWRPGLDADRLTELPPQVFGAMAASSIVTDRAVLITDPAGVVLWANAAYERLTEYKLSEIVGRHPRDYLYGVDTDPGAVRYIRSQMERGVRFRIELKQYTKSRRAFWNEIEGQPIHDHLQRLTGFVGFAQDVSHRRRRIQELRASESFLRATINALPDAIAILDRRGRVKHTNIRWIERAADLGFEPQRFLDHLAQQRSKEWDGREYDALQRVLAGEIDSTELEIERRREEISRWELLRIRRFDGQGLPHVIVAYSDITLRKRSELEHFVARKTLALKHEELRTKQALLEKTNADLKAAREKAEQAARSKSEFLANMSHEIRTPMTAILGFAEMLRDNRINESERHDAILTILRNGEHLLTIINDILDLSKIEAGKMKAELRPTNIRDFLNEILGLMRIRTQAKSLALRLHLESDLPERLMTDPTRVRQILLNLVGNAIKFTEEGEVTLEVRRSNTIDNAVDFDVIDTGIGMTPAQSASLFQAFSQADASMARRFGGTGLGLIISQRLARMLGGDVWIVRSEPNAGTRFRLQLPLTLVPPEPSEPAERTPPLTQVSRPIIPRLTGRVLLAEDGIDNRRLLTALLHKTGVETDVAENGAVAVQMVKDAVAAGTPYNLILMDMQMPELDGYGAARILRDSGFYTPIIALTAHACPDEKQKCFDAGCNDFEAKPVDRARFYEILCKYLVPADETQQAAASLESNSETAQNDSASV